MPNKRFYNSKKSYKLTKDGLREKFPTRCKREARIHDLKRKIDRNKKTIWAIEQKLKWQVIEMEQVEKLIQDIDDGLEVIQRKSRKTKAEKEIVEK